MGKVGKFLVLDSKCYISKRVTCLLTVVIEKNSQKNRFNLVKIR